MQINLGKTSIDAYKYAVQGNAILGTRGAGKTYASKLMAEKLMECGIPVVVIDPIGVWKHLKTANPDGGKSYPVIVMGKTEDSDVDLSEDTIEDVIQMVLETRSSLVVDLYHPELLGDWDEIVSTIMRVLLYKNQEYGLRHVFFEEAAEFVHQSGKKTESSVWIERLVRMSGNVKVGTTFINQTAEQLSKAILKLCDGLILGRQKEHNSIRTIQKWLQNSGVAMSGDIAAEIPNLESGEFFVWSTADNVPVKVKFPLISSYHPSRNDINENDIRLEWDVSGVIERMKSLSPYEVAEPVNAEQFNEVPVKIEGEKLPVIQVSFNRGELDSFEQYTVNTATRTPYGSTNVRMLIDGLIAKGYVYRDNGYFKSMQNAEGNVFVLSSKIEQEYAELACRNVVIL